MAVVGRFSGSTRVADNFVDQLTSALENGAASLRAARLPAELAVQFERLARQGHEPCVLAVVGRMKAGKSTFINALLGEDVAKVGVTETTATINRFCFGTPTDLARPIRCYWRGGRHEDVGRDFLDGLQGNDAESLRRASGIDLLEYYLPNEFLRDVTLVDTPGTAAVVDEHQNRTAEFLTLQKQMRERVNKETQRLSSEADAVIYLVGSVARTTDQAFLDEFGQTTGGKARALNAVGVMAKIDLQSEILERRHELATKIADQLKSNLNTVVPVSAGIYQALNGLRENDNRNLIHLMTQLRKVPPLRLRKMLDSIELYEMDFSDCPVSVEERRQLLGDMPWTVFTTIARQAADPSLNNCAIVEQLVELAGFAPLRDVLERHFFKRAKFLRCYRILRDARQILNDIRYRQLPDLRKKDRDDQAKCGRFLHFIRSAQGDADIAKELETFVFLQFGSASRADRVETIVKDLDRSMGRLFHDMEEYNADFDALEQLDKAASLFSTAELDELRCVLGLYGTETAKRLPAGRATIEHAGARQQVWNETSVRARESIRRELARRAVERYGVILHELTAGPPSNSLKQA